ncbi:Decapping and exoribonuclease protein, partial [Pseudolycoriella hygida]
MMDRATRKKVNKSSKRDVLIKDVTNDLIVNKRRPWSHYSKESRGSKPTTKATEISQPQLIGHFVADIYGKNLVLDGCGDIRIYNLPIIKTVIEENEKLDDSDEENAVDDWEQLADRVLKDNGYIPLSEGGNVVSFTNQKCDRTGGMRWMDDENVSELSNKRSFAGLRFEDFISRGVNGEEHGPSNGENNNYRDSLKYYNVVKLTFDKYKLLISGETDCVFPESSAALGKKPKAGDFIELKTSLSFEHWSDPKRMSPFVRCSKMSTWFAQCILMGIEHVVVGIREEIDDQIICK